MKLKVAEYGHLAKYAPLLYKEIYKQAHLHSLQHSVSHVIHDFQMSTRVPKEYKIC